MEEKERNLCLKLIKDIFLKDTNLSTHNLSTKSLKIILNNLFQGFTTSLKSEIPIVLASFIKPLDSDEVLSRLCNIVIRKDSKVEHKLVFETIGYFAEKNAIVSNDIILTSIVIGIQDTDDDVVLSSLFALKNSLSNFQNNIKKKNEREYLLKVLLNSSKSKNEKVREKSFQCLNMIFEENYDVLEDYFSDLRDLSLYSIEYDSDSVIMEGIEFWNWIAEIERDIKEGGDFDKKCKNYLPKGLEKGLLKLLLKCLGKQDESKEFNQSVSASICINLIAQTIDIDYIFDDIKNFIDTNINNDDWHLKDASLMAFIAILENSCSEVKFFLKDNLLKVLDCTLDKSIQIKDTSIFFIGKAFENHSEIMIEHEKYFYQHFLKIMKEKNEESIIAKVFWSLYQMFTYGSKDLYNYEKDLLKIFDDVLNMEFSNPKLFLNVVESTSSFISICKEKDDLFNLAQNIIKMFQDKVQNRKGNEDLSKYSIIISSLLDNLNELMLKDAPKIMDLTLDTKFPQDSDQIFLLTSLLKVLKEEFLTWIKPVFQLIKKNLKQTDQLLIEVTLGLTSSIVMEFKEEILPFCDDLMTSYIQLIYDNSIQKELKILLIDCIAEISFATHEDFEKYLSVVMQILLRSFEIVDIEEIEYRDKLFTSVIQCLSAIVQSTSGNLHIFEQYLTEMEKIYSRILRSNMNAEVIDESLMLLSDLIQLHGLNFIKHNLPLLKFIESKSETKGGKHVLKVMKKY